MSEPLRTERADPGPLSEAERAARIEELLLAGLDQYFCGHYEQAIDIWTRIAFFERGHGRARAYIERARSALAERQRESEEILHDGVAAYQAGDRHVARELLTRAVEQGGASDTALVFLQRLGRLDAASEAVTARQSPPSDSTSNRRARVATVVETNWLFTLCASVAVAAVILFAALPVASWVRELPVATTVAPPEPAEPLPVIRPDEVRLERARALFEAGRPHEALRLLESAAASDSHRAARDLLRAEIQRAILAPRESRDAVDAGAPAP